METSALFDIQGVDCGYSNRPVLKIDALTIKKVPITFILGPSGIGKSTLLEMLGLMSNTIVKHEGFFQYFDDAGQKVDFSNFWNWPEARQSVFRKTNFSFVFQQTNLMQNLNIIENLCLPLMIQGENFENAASAARSVAENMGLSEALMNRKITAISGGQLQRVAFTRALTANFKVLFGDEPTGNLDVHNALNLMEHLRQNLVQKNASAIIVSHDIQLAEKFGDCIINIQKESFEDGYFGRIDPSCITLK